MRECLQPVKQIKQFYSKIFKTNIRKKNIFKYFKKTNPNELSIIKAVKQIFNSRWTLLARNY